MDILTKVRQDHKNIHSLLQQIIDRVEEGDNISILLEDLFEEIEEHVKAEKVCVLEMFSKEEKQEDQAFTQIDKEEIFEFLSNKLYEEIGCTFKANALKKKLYDLRKVLQEHSQYMENVILLLSKDCINDQESEKLSLKFEEEKMKILVSGITYA